MRRRVSLLGTGGTISAGTAHGVAEPRHGVDELAARIAVDADSVELHAREVLRLPSRAITPADMWELAKVVREEVADGVDGVVVTHGTDTMEETAYALALLADTRVPIVLTGAMTPPDMPGSDASANLNAAVVAAACSELNGFGPVIVHQNEIHAARWVIKVFSSRVAAFASPAAGPVGHISEGHVYLLSGAPPDHECLRSLAPPDRRVELIWAAAGSDGMLVDAVSGRVDGLVVAGTGGGHVSPPLAESLLRLVERGCPVVLASRCVGGQVLAASYGGAGSETHLLSAGLLSAGSLQPLKARLRLLFGLSAGMRAEELFPTKQVAV